MLLCKRSAQKLGGGSWATAEAGQKGQNKPAVVVQELTKLTPKGRRGKKPPTTKRVAATVV